MNLMRFTVVDGAGVVSFVFDGAALSVLLPSCAEARDTLKSFVDALGRHAPRVQDYLTCGLAVFDEHNSPSNLTAIHQAIEHFPPDEWPVFRVVDEITREASLRPTRTGVIVFNLAERRIVQIQNSYLEILDVAQWVRRLQRAGWRIVP